MRGPLTARAIAAVAIITAGAAIGALAASSQAASRITAENRRHAGRAASRPVREVTGTLTGAPGTTGGQVIELQVAPFPYRGFSNLTHVVTAADGSFAFPRRRPIATRATASWLLRLAVDQPASQVYVDAPAELRARSQGPGQVLLTIVTTHPSTLVWRGTTVYWFLAVRGGHTGSWPRRPPPAICGEGHACVGHRRSPAKRFLFSACLNPTR